MRWMGWSVILSSCLVTGCTRMFGPGTNTEGNPPARQTNQIPTAPDLVSYLNREANRLQSLQCDNLYISASMPGELLPGMKGILYAQSPRNFRMTGAVASMDQVDIGSNNDLFWFWIKQDPNKSIYYCRYDDFKQGVQLPFPFQPEWVLQCLGMATYETGRDYKLEVKKDTFELVDTTVLQGVPVKKIVVFNRNHSGPSDPVVKAHVVQDAKSGKVICSAEITRVKYANVRHGQDYAAVAYPQEIMLKWPEQKFSMKLKLDDVTVNQPLPPDTSREMFTMLQLPKTPQVDLARGMRTTPTARTIEQTGVRRTETIRYRP